MNPLIIAAGAICGIAGWLWWRKKKAAEAQPPHDGIAMILAEPRALNA